jgi:hypothetical protein
MQSQYIIVQFEVVSFTVVNGTIFRSEFAWQGASRKTSSCPVFGMFEIKIEGESSCR